MSSYSDEILTAYVDGELTVAETSEVRVALATDPSLRARLDALTVDRDGNRAVFHDMPG